MASSMFSFLGGKKGAAPAAAARGSPPMPAGRRVQDLSAKGFSEQDIIKTMRAEGYSPGEVDNAFSDTMRSTIGGQERPAFDNYRPPGPQIQPQQAPQTSRQPEPYDEELDGPEPGYGPQQNPEPDFPPERIHEMPEIPGERRMMQRPPAPVPAQRDYPEDYEPEPYYPQQQRPLPRDVPHLPRAEGMDRKRDATERRREEIEELTEELVDEKWAVVETRIRSVESRFDDFNRRVAELEAKIGGMKTDVDKKVRESEDKVENYKSDVSEIGAKIGSMENVMKETLGPMMESIRTLSEGMKSMKRQQQVRRPDSALDTMSRPARETYADEEETNSGEEEERPVRRPER